MSRPPTSSFSFAQLASLGHEGSPGRTRRAGAFSGMAARRVLGNTGRKARAAARLSRLLLFSKKAKVSLTALRNAFSSARLQGGGGGELQNFRGGGASARCRA